MITKQWKRAGIGICTATALVVGAGIAFAPAANAAPTAGPSLQTTGLLTGVVTTAGDLVGGLLTPNPAATSPVTVGTSAGGITVGVGSTTVGVGAGNGTVGVGVTGTGGSAIGVNLGTSSSSTTVTANTSSGTGTSTGTNTSSSANTSTSSSTNSSSDSGTGTTTGSGSGTGTRTTTAIMLTAIRATEPYQTVYPAKDGYRDSVTFQLEGTTTDGQQHAASGTATLTHGSSTVATWPITATDNAITWNGLKAGKIVTGRYLFTAKIGDGAGTAVSGTESIYVSAKKLASATRTLSAKAVTGKHTMAVKPRAGLSKGKVTLKISSKVTGVQGKQYLVFTHGAKKLKVLLKNGTHTSKAVTIPKSFTTYTISHTWKKHTVKIASLKYKYTFETLK